MPINPSQNPLAGPTVSGNTYTVDRWLKSPTMVSRAMADMVVNSPDFFLDKVFATVTGVDGGAVLYEPVEANSLYSDRNVEEIAPGEEFPVLTSSRGVPKVARVKKFGGQIYITDEAKRRNNTVTWDRENRKLANTLNRQLNAVGIAVLNAAIADSDATTGGARTGTGVSWSDAAALTNDNVAPTLLPHADFIKVRKQAYTERQGVAFDTLIVNPTEDQSLELIYGDRPNGLTGVLNRFGITNYFVTDQQTAGKAKFVASKQVGGFGTEDPISTETWRTPGNERTDLKIRATPVFWADNRWAILELDGLEA